MRPALSSARCSAKFPLARDLNSTNDAVRQVSALLEGRVRAHRRLRAASCVRPVQLALTAAVVGVLWRLAMAECWLTLLRKAGGCLALGA